MNFKLKLNDSIRWFNITILLIFIVTIIIESTKWSLIFYSGFLIVLLLFIMYSIIRYNHYILYFSKSQSLKYLVLDNVPLLAGVVYYVLMEVFYFNKSEINFIFIFSLIPFLIPTGIGHDRLMKKSKK